MTSEERHALTIRLDNERYEWLRRRAFDTRIPMQKILEEAIDLLRNNPKRSRKMGGQR